ncbi:SDR family NAD(P)-dependent oxidoreductase [Kitasatospora sp. NPDC058046]|uniref:SDR family NAD(P)-dependent oxidoreductase n=1 Tax=Kitasatospora sp. NPDC058046 TaxID=3346312 RepID=UPI0036DE3088
MARTPIAIVGMAGIFPRARTAREFWSNVVTGEDCTGDVPKQWWDVAHHYDPDLFAQDKTYSRRGGFLPAVTFDPLEFAMPPASVSSVGLVQLLGLVVARDVLRDAGCPGAPWYDPSRTGVVLGVCGANSSMMPLGSRLLAPDMRRAARASGLREPQIDTFIRHFLELHPEWTEDSFPGLLGNIVAGRVANRFGFGAANYTVDAACASSLAALRGAVAELLDHRADLMITGGCDADNSIVTYLCFSKTPALSPSDRSRPFDRDADGTLLGEGVGMLALKRLADAERDGDRVYAVLRGLGSSSDGRTGSVYAPCGDGQLAALRAAYADAAVAPSSVELIEAHGTGTSVGDTVEANALATFLRAPGDRRFAAVGSVKSQIGHAKAAAGTAGLMKAALALHHRLLPPTIGVDHPSEAFAPGEDQPLYLNTRARPWIQDPNRPVRRAGVSAFGFGGINFHAVLEEHPASHGHARIAHPAPRAHLWHAPDPESLLSLLESDAGPDSGPIPADHARLGYVAVDCDTVARLRSLAVAQLRAQPGHQDWHHAEGIHYRRRALPAGTKVAALFAGQGSQYVNMGLEALLTIPPLRTAFDSVNAQWDDSEPLARVVFPPPGGDRAVDTARLRRTAYAQPAIAALSMGQFRYLTELGLTADAMLGHSFGELTALWAAGSLRDDLAMARLATARGRAMEAATEDGDPGAMVSVRLPEPQAVELALEFAGLVVCNRNTQDDVVLGGPTASVVAFVEECQRRNIPAYRLPVAAAFHTSHVRSAVGAFAQSLAKERIGPPTVPVLANTSGASYGPDPEHNRRVLAEQLGQPINFAARLRELYEDGVRVFVEFGPRQVLSGLVRRCFEAAEVEAVPTDIGEDADSALALKLAAVRLAVLGLPIEDINRYDADEASAPAEPSAVAQVLRGPNFAVNAVRAGLPVPAAVEADQQPSAVRPVQSADLPQPPTPPVPRHLADAATEHLTMHNRFLSGQLDIARELATALADPDPDPQAAARAELVQRHSLALSEAHTRASELFAGLLHLPFPSRAAAAAVAAPPAPSRPSDTDPPTGDAPYPGTPPYTSREEGPPASGAARETGIRPAQLPAARPATADLLRASTTGVTGPSGASPAALDAPMAVVDLEEVERVLREIVAEKTGYAFDMVDPDLEIRADLGIDSLKQVEVAAEAWRRYPVIPREEIYRFAEAHTIRELSALLREVLTTTTTALSIADPVPLGRAFLSLCDLPVADRLLDAYGPKPAALLIDDGSGLAANLSAALYREGWQVRTAALPEVPVTGSARALADWSEEEVTAAVCEAGTFDLCLLPAGQESLTDPEHVIARLRHAVLLAKHCASVLRATAHEQSHRAGFVTVTDLDGSLGLAGSGARPWAAQAAGLGGLVKTLALEEPTLFCRAVDLDPELDEAATAEALLTELYDPNTAHIEVAVGSHSRRRPELTPAPAPLTPTPPDTEVRPQDLLLVTGGARGITSWCVERLAQQTPAGFLLLGRTPLTDDPGWVGDTTDPALLRELLAQRMREEGRDPDLPAARTTLDQQTADLACRQEIRATLTTLRAHGATAEYLAADLADPEAVRIALAPHRSRITGLLHGAGVLADEPLATKSPHSIARVIDAKLTGLRTVLATLDPEQLRHLVVFTSIAGIFGNARQTDYALANEALNRFACAWQAAHPRCRVSAIAWGPWQGGMASPGMQDIFLQHGVPLLTREQGGDYFVQQMSPAHTSDLVTVIGPTEPVLRRRPQVLTNPLTVRRPLAGLADQPLLDHHRIDGVPVLPMTAAVGGCLNLAEQLQDGRSAVACTDFTIQRGLLFDGTQPEHLHHLVKPAVRTGGLTIGVHDNPSKPARYEGQVLTEDRTPAPGPLTLPEQCANLSRTRLHPAYADGFLFHGPAIQGLYQVFEQDDDRLVIAARLDEPLLAGGTFAGRRYNPGSADLLLQAAALLGRERVGYRCLPVAVDHVALHAPLPDGRPFVIVAEAGEQSPLSISFTVSACTPSGKVLQRWTGLKTIIAVPQLAARAAWPHADEEPRQ